jgi:hypothetical protein
MKTNIFYSETAEVKPAYKPKTVYLAGKITGLPRWWVVAKFVFFDLYLTFRGYQVYNPATMISKKTEYSEAMTICIKNLNNCEYVYFQPDWWISIGARIEFEVAAKAGKTLLNHSYKTRGIFEFMQREVWL